MRDKFGRRAPGLNEVCRTVGCGKGGGTRLRDKFAAELAAARRRGRGNAVEDPLMGVLSRIAAALEQIARKTA